jgi:hypothetical protein
LGETNAHRSAAVVAATPFWFGAPRRLWLRLLKRCLFYHFHRFASPSPVWVVQLQNYAYAKGMARYWRQKRHQLKLSI